VQGVYDSPEADTMFFRGYAADSQCSRQKNENLLSRSGEADPRSKVARPYNGATGEINKIDFVEKVSVSMTGHPCLGA